MVFEFCKLWNSQTCCWVKIARFGGLWIRFWSWSKVNVINVLKLASGWTLVLLQISACWCTLTSVAALNASCGQLSSRLVYIRPWKDSSATLCRFGLWTAYSLVRHLITPVSKLFRWAFVLIYAKNMILSLILCTFSDICLCRSCGRIAWNKELEIFGGLFLWCEDRANWGLSRLGKPGEETESKVSLRSFRTLGGEMPKSWRRTA